MPTSTGRRVVSVSVTAAGRALAARLPYPSHHGALAETVRRLWDDVDALVLMVASGAAVRIVGPLLADKETDPAVVCVDEAARWAVSLCGGHAAGANALAAEVAALLGAEAVVTTATDATETVALDLLPGYRAAGDVAGVTRAMLEGRSPLIEVELPGWPAPAALRSGSGPERVVVTDRVVRSGAGVALLHPPSLAVGIGCSSDAPADEGRALLAEVLADAGLAPHSVELLATIDRRAGHPLVLATGLPVRAFSAEELDSVSVPNPSDAVARAVGTSSVAEAAAMLAAGPGASLVVTKRASAHATVAVARRLRPAGKLWVVGLGPGEAAQRTPAAAAAVRGAEVVVGYTPYLEQAAELLSPSQLRQPSPIGAERDRALRSLQEAAAGRRVALVCSGDAGVFAMAAVVAEMAPDVAPGVEVEVVPGVTAALAAAARLGAPLGHDHAVISLSDLLTPWEVIERRLAAAAAADLVVALYNPRSGGRHWQLEAARAIFLRHRCGATPVGVVTDAYRPDEKVTITTLEDLDAGDVGMTTMVVVGATSTRLTGGRMVTPRGYAPCQ